MGQVIEFTRYLDVTWMPLSEVRERVKALGWKGFKIDWKQSGEGRCVIERQTS